MHLSIVMQKPLLKSDLRIWREHDAIGLNIILNHPEVRPWVADINTEGPLDVSHVVANSDNILLMGEYGAILFICIMPGTYECHTQILPDGRGEWASKFAISVLDWMFAKSNAWEVTTRVPEGHIGALALSRSVGFRHEFTSMEPCRFHGKIVPAHILRLSIHEWAAQSNLYAQLGRELHDQMAAEAIRLGIIAPPHQEDVFHSQVSGVAVEMARHGLMVKAVMFYSRWSALARHRPISMVSVEPPVILMDLGKMRITPTGVEIVP